jgi:hypothetical protein
MPTTWLELWLGFAASLPLSIWIANAMRGLIECDQAATRYALTEQGRAALSALLAKGER